MDPVALLIQLVGGAAGGNIAGSESEVPGMLNLAVSGVLDVKLVTVTINKIEHVFVVRKNISKPEELRVFLEEAAGVSKYRERRKETEARLRDTRENLLRVDDIRQELAKQIEHLQAQAEVARKYHELQSELTTSQNLLWFTRKKEAVAARARHARDIERTGLELEAETARLREAEKRLEELRSEHYKAGDALHACQGALYEANAEVARLEQQITHVRDNRARIEHHIGTDRKSTRLNSSHIPLSRMPSSA